MKRIRLDADDLEYEAAHPVEHSPKKINCPATGKIAWRKQSKAEHTAKNMRRLHRDPFIVAYRCKYCGLWHTGHDIGTNQARKELTKNHLSGQ